MSTGADDRAPVQVLLDAMQAMGVPTDGLTFTEERYTVNNPVFAPWERHLVTVDIGIPQKISFDVNLMRAHPEVSVVELQSYMQYHSELGQRQERV